MNSKLIAKLKRSFRTGGGAKNTLAGAALGGTLSAGLGYSRAKKAQNQGIKGVNPLREALASAAMGTLVGSQLGALSSSLAREKHLFRNNHIQGRYDDGVRDFYKSASIPATAKGAALGALVSGASFAVPRVTYNRVKKKYDNRPVTAREIIGRTVGGALVGAYGGAQWKTLKLLQRENITKVRSARKAAFKGGKADAAFREAMAGMKGATKANIKTPFHQVHLDNLEAPNGFKSKAEAKAHYRKMMSKYHPDKNPGKDTTAHAQKLQTAWDGLKNTEYFEKLATILFPFKRAKTPAKFSALKAAATRRLEKIAEEPSIKPSHKGLLHEKLGVPQGEKIPAGKLKAALKSNNPKLRQEANFAENAKKWHHKKAEFVEKLVAYGAPRQQAEKLFDKTAGAFMAAVGNELASLPGDAAGGLLGAGLGKLVTPSTDDPSQKKRNEVIGGVVGAKAGGIATMALLEKHRAANLLKAASVPGAVSRAARFTGENMLLSGAGGIVGQEVANDTASDEVLTDPKKSARRAALGALAGTGLVGLGVSFAHELKK